ncbi:uncharacterized protein A1O9_01255, partial [Exophiala aquamarina CBS 119918]
PLSYVAISALAYGVAAQTASFANTTWGSAVVGTVWPIHWTVGDGTPVSLFLGNDTWQWNIFANEPAALLTYEWTVSLPPGAVPGEYHIGLVQRNQLTASPLFAITLPPVESSTTSWTSWPTISPSANATLISASLDPTVTVTYWDHACGCSKTSAMASPTAPATNLPGTQYSWWDEHCGCTKSAVVPVPTAAPGSNWTTPAPTANVPPAPPP